MLFHVTKTLMDRRGRPIREPKPGEKAQLNDKGEPIGFDDTQLRDMTHGDIAILALDMTLHGDEDEMRKNPAQWVKAVMRRERIASRIADAASGDGWVELDESQKDLLAERLAMFVTRSNLNLTAIGPVLEALEHPPKERTERKGVKIKGHGKNAASDETRPGSPGLA